MRRALYVVITVAVAVGLWAAYRAVDRRAQQRELDSAKSANTLDAYAQYLAKYPQGVFRSDAQTQLDARKTDLTGIQQYDKSLEQIAGSVYDYFAGMDGVTRAPSGAELLLSMMQVTMSVAYADKASKPLAAKLRELEAALKPIAERNRAFLDSMKDGAGPTQRALEAYIRQYPSTSIMSILDALKPLIATERVAIVPRLQELARYEKAVGSGAPAPSAR
jgi:hypothetical protein